LTNFKGSTALLLYLERVKLMGKEKYRELVKKDQETVIQTFLEITQLVLELEGYSQFRK
jgi:hypothetical protein